MINRQFLCLVISRQNTDWAHALPTDLLPTRDYETQISYIAVDLTPFLEAQNTGVVVILSGRIFQIQELNCVPHCRWLIPVEPPGSPKTACIPTYNLQCSDSCWVKDRWHFRHGARKKERLDVRNVLNISWSRPLLHEGKGLSRRLIQSLRNCSRQPAHGLIIRATTDWKPRVSHCTRHQAVFAPDSIGRFCQREKNEDARDTLFVLFLLHCISYIPYETKTSAIVKKWECQFD